MINTRLISDFRLALSDFAPDVSTDTGIRKLRSYSTLNASNVVLYLKVSFLLYLTTSQTTSQPLAGI